MAMKKKKTRKAAAPGKYPTDQSPVVPVSSARKPSVSHPASVGKSVGALMVRVRSYFLCGKTAEA
jgi:hypothetical protein